MSDFDPAKEAINLSKHGVSLGRWVDLDIKVTFVDDRYDYGEVRYRAYGFIDGVAYCLAFTNRNGQVRADQPSTRPRKGDEAPCLVS
jgi:uncharacterized protein